MKDRDLLRVAPYLIDTRESRSEEALIGRPDCGPPLARSAILGPRQGQLAATLHGIPNIVPLMDMSIRF